MRRCAIPAGTCYCYNIVLCLVVRAVLWLSYLCCMLLCRSFLCIIWRWFCCSGIWSAKVLEKLQTFRVLNKLGSSKWNYELNAVIFKCGYIESGNILKKVWYNRFQTLMLCLLKFVSQIRPNFFQIRNVWYFFLCVQCLVCSGVVLCHLVKFSNAFSEPFVACCTWQMICYCRQLWQVHTDDWNFGFPFKQATFFQSSICNQTEWRWFCLGAV